MNLTHLISRVRLELQDQPEPFRSTVSCDGTAYWYDLPKQQVEPGSVEIQDQSGPALTTLSEGTDYIVDYVLGQFQLANPPQYQDELVISGSSWRMFSDADLTIYVSDAFNQHTLRLPVHRAIPQSLTASSPTGTCRRPWAACLPSRSRW